MKYNIVVGHERLIVIPKVHGSLCTKITNKLKFRVKGYRFTHAYKVGHWDGYIKLFRYGQNAPSGCYVRIAKILQDNGHKVKVTFTNGYEPIGDGKIFGIKKLENFQERATEKAIKHRFCVVKAPVRAGKTAIAAKIISQIGHFPVMVLTKSEKDLTAQIRRELSKYLKKKIGTLSEGVFDKRDIVVSNYGALDRGLFPKKLKKGKKPSEKTKIRNQQVLDFVTSTKVLILDECHHAVAPSSLKYLKKFKSIGYKIGLSATPLPSKSSLLELESAIGPIVVSVKFDTLIKEGRLTQPIIILYNLPSDWYAHHFHSYEDIYESNVVRNQYRNRFIAEVVKNLAASGKTSFITISKIYHGEMLRSMIPNSFFINGRISTKARLGLYKSLESKKLSCVISTVGKEGLDIPKLDAIINAEGFESPVATIQKMRSLTASKDKNFGLVIDFIDKGKYLIDHSMARKRKYESIRGFVIKKRRVRKDIITKS